MARLQPLPDLILLDVKLPDIHGYIACVALKQDALTAAIPVIFLSSYSDVGNITHGLELGAVDYVSKPVVAPILLARIKTHLRLRRSSDLLRNQNLNLESLIRKRTSDLETRTADLERRTTELHLSHDLTIVALGTIAKTRDNETGKHIQRTKSYVQVIADRLAPLQRYRDTVTHEQWTQIWKSAPLHDIGKVGIPDHILLKPGKLTTEEFQVMKQHPVIGRDALRMAGKGIGLEFSFLSVAKDIAYGHHERWDGTGYPEGIKGEAIPLAARMMTIADVYDAMISKRVYKPALPHATAIEAIRDGRGGHFDPSLVDCFLEDADEFHCIASRFRDEKDETEDVVEALEEN